MKLSVPDSKWCREYAKANGISPVEVAKCITAYFDDMRVEVSQLPLNNITRIYTVEAIDNMVPVYHIPFIGRIGPMYHLYLKWRREQAEEKETVLREKVKAAYLAQRIEEAAALALSGKYVSADFLDNPVPKNKYQRVWIIDEHGRRKAAKQLYKKQ